MSSLLQNFTYKNTNTKVFPCDGRSGFIVTAVAWVTAEIGPLAGEVPHAAGVAEKKGNTNISYFCYR